MSYTILLHPKANDELNKLDKQIAQRIKKSLKELQEEPEKKGTKLRYTDFWRIRIGDYRAIYEIDNRGKRVIILYIGHRSSVYDDFSKVI